MQGEQTGSSYLSEKQEWFRPGWRQTRCEKKKNKELKLTDLVMVKQIEDNGQKC